MHVYDTRCTGYYSQAIPTTPSLRAALVVPRVCWGTSVRRNTQSAGAARVRAAILRVATTQARVKTRDSRLSASFFFFFYSPVSAKKDKKRLACRPTVCQAVSPSRPSRSDGGDEGGREEGRRRCSRESSEVSVSPIRCLCLVREMLFPSRPSSPPRGAYDKKKKKRKITPILDKAFL